MNTDRHVELAHIFTAEIQDPKARVVVGMLLETVLELRARVEVLEAEQARLSSKVSSEVPHSSSEDKP